jgi:drug/metabolite transporter (DMT)-like permease
MQQQSKATLYALATVFIWSTVASAFKLSLQFLQVTQLLFFSSLTSVLVLLALLAMQGQLGFFKSLGWREWGFSLLLGLFNPFAYYLVLFKAYDLLPAQEAQPLNYTWAITLSLLSVPLLKQRIKAWDLLALIISYLGVFVIGVRGEVASLELSNPLGVGLALFSTLIWALYWIFNTRDPMAPTRRLFLNFLFGTLFSGLTLVCIGNWHLPPLKGLLGAAYVGFFEMGITFVLWSTALKLSRTALQVSIFIYLSPFLSLVFIHVFVGEAILPSTIMGLLLIMTGIGLQQFSAIRRNPV